MARPYGRQARGGKAKVDPALALRAQAVTLFDSGDGHGADWAAAAVASLRVAFYCLQNLPADSADRGAITRRAHDFAYGLMVGTPDSDAPFAAGEDKPQRLAFSMAEPAPGHDPDRPGR